MSKKEERKKLVQTHSNILRTVYDSIEEEGKKQTHTIIGIITVTQQLNH